MRLKQKDVSAIFKGLNEVIQPQTHFELFLFGSRTDDNKLGGDIDLLLVVPQVAYDLLTTQKHLLISQAKKYLIDQKCDITIRPQETLNQDPFYLSIQEQIIKLNA